MQSKALDFGTKWLGEMPNDWVAVRLNQVLVERKEKSTPRDIHLTPSQKYAVLPQSEYMKLTGGRVVLNLMGADNMKHVEPGDFVVHLRSFQGGIEYSKYRGKVSSAYTVLKPQAAVVDGFYRYVLKSHGFISELSRTTDQLRDGQSIKYSQLDLLKFPLPSKNIQQEIAYFLDEETAKIDNLIAKQEKLLTLLEEKRRATITHAVIRGLDSEVELKEAGTPWLEQVPAHWRVRKLGSLTRLVVGSTPSTQNSGDFDGDQVWVTIADMRSKNISSSKQMLTMNSVKNKNMELIPAGSLLFSFKLSVGKVGYADVDLYTNEAIAAFLPNTNVLSNFLYYAAQTYFVNEANTNIYGAAIFNQESLKRVRVAYPSIEEQQGIVSYLDKLEQDTLEIKYRVLDQINLLRERRISLISHVVTGKIRV